MAKKKPPTYFAPDIPWSSLPVLLMMAGLIIIVVWMIGWVLGTILSITLGDILFTILVFTIGYMVGVSRS